MVNVKCDLCGGEVHNLKYVIDMSENNLRYYRYVRNIPDKEKMTGEHHIVQCSNCDLIFTNPRFSTEELKLVYSSQKIIGGNWKDFRYLFNSKLPDELQGLKRKTSNDPRLYQWRFDIINKYCPTDSKQLKLIDIGCGNGQFVNDAINNGFDAIGIDLSSDRIEQGKELYGLEGDTLKCMNVDNFSMNEKYDIVVMWDVIEHVESLTAILESLKKSSMKKRLYLP